MSLTIDQLRAVPKVLLHDHLDGGLRPATIIDLARETGYSGLPTTDPGELAQALAGPATHGNLELYLQAFRHTVGGDADQGRADPGGRRSAPRTWPTTG